jgi:D-alanyl-D-alanine carboxypeptidase
MVVWDEALYSNRLLPARSLEAMFTEYKGSYCYGWFHSDFHSRSEFGHGGGIAGFATQVLRHPKEKVYIVVLSNCDWANSSEIAKQLRRMLFNE